MISRMGIGKKRKRIDRPGEVFLKTPQAQELMLRIVASQRWENDLLKTKLHGFIGDRHGTMCESEVAQIGEFLESIHGSLHQC
jgi:hypothetical protein